jgi:hypothetical protein
MVAMKAGSFKASISSSRITTFLACITMFLLWQRSAYANEPIFVGLLGSSAPIMIGIMTKGLAFIGVVLIEAVVFARLLSMNWLKSLWASLVLNVFSSVVGILIGAVGFSSSVGSIIITVVVVLSVIYVLRFKAPIYYKAVAITGIIAGYIGVGFAASALPHLRTLLVFLLIIAPLIFGFGLTLWLEGAIAGRYLDPEKKWHVLMKANFFSYLFLLVMVVFFSPNPYSANAPYLYWEYKSRVDDGVVDRSEILTMLRDQRAPTLFLLGLSKNDLPGPDYPAYVELKVLKDGYTYLTDYMNQDYETGIAIVDDTLLIPTLTPDAAEQLEKIREYLIFCIRVIDALENSDDDEAEIIIKEYEDWWNANPTELESYNISDFSEWSETWRRWMYERDISQQPTNNY